MKRFVCIFVAALVLGITERCLGQYTGSFQIWNIAEDPNVTFIQSTNMVIVDYNISQELSSDNIRTQMLTGVGDENCTHGLSDGILDERLDARGAQVFSFDTQILSQNDDVFVPDYPNNKAMMKFCLYYQLWNGPESDDTSRLLSSMYTLLTINFDMQDDFEIDTILVQPKDIVEATENKGYDVEGYLCNPLTFEQLPMPNDPYNQGALISVCVEISQAAVADGLYLKEIDSFVWTRQVFLGGSPTNLQQYSIKDGVAANPLTDYNCPRHALVCSFQTILQADFYIVPGDVSGAGFAYLAFKDLDTETTSTRHYRELGTSDADETTMLRSLQDQGQESTNSGLASSSYGFGMSILLATVEDRPSVLKTSGSRINIALGFGIQSFAVAFVSIFSLCA